MIIKKNVSTIMIITLLVISLTTPLYVLASGICIHKTPQIKNIRTGKEYTNSSGSYCFSNMEYITYHCNDCGATWTTTNNVSSVPHQWKEIIDSYDDYYLYYFNVCNECNCKKFSRKVLHNGILPWNFQGQINYIK